MSITSFRETESETIFLNLHKLLPLRSSTEDNTLADVTVRLPALYLDFILSILLKTSCSLALKFYR